MPNQPEILAPAGDEAALRAALAAGADAVYFGLDEGFNARARARNFPLSELAETVARIHRAGARAYVTTNTLVFEPELEHVERVLRGIAAAGVDAIIAQDPAVALIARAICPDLEIHASTQMTIASPAAASFARDLGVTRIVVPRELSIEEIRRFREGTELELEVFVHGALCMSWSGQCLTSEAWGGRSANRGQCAQSCRLPYELVVDGQRRELGELKYLLSPRDLAGAPVLPDLVDIGVHTLKIEGRQKSPEYVSTAVGGYRRWLDALVTDADRGKAEARLQTDLEAMALSYTRGFGTGFFHGSDHQTLVDGRFPKHRGILLGTVRSIRGDEVEVDAVADLELRPGMGVVFDNGVPQDKEPGGPLFRVSRLGDRLRLGFGKPGPDMKRVAVGHRVWATGDPAIAREVERGSAREPEGRVPVELTVSGAEGRPLVIEARAGAHRARAESSSPLLAARNEGLGLSQLTDKLGALGGTPFRLAAIHADDLPAGLHLAPSELKALRRGLVDQLLPQVERGSVRELAPEGVTARLTARYAAVDALPDEAPRVVPLCRSDEQLEAVIDAGLPEVELDWMELVGLGRAVERARSAGLRVTLATLRVTKPGEEPFDDRIWKLAPDAILVRHWAALERFRDRGGPALHGDFSLNVTNSITARFLLERGLQTVTASFDLDEKQLDGLLAATPAHRVTVMVYHRIPTFHTEHCLYSHLLSSGRDYRSCGRPCEKHQISVRDPYGGREHPIIVDAGCRNTVFNHQTQSAAMLIPRLVERGVRRFRVQLVRETRDETRAVLEAHAELLRGELDPSALVARLGLSPQLGVSAGMATLV